jgi:metal-responsive CopG/Arc/MetJ family transcriptional regulator
MPQVRRIKHAMARKPETDAKAKKPSRSERLAAALRENLRRRKAQERQRSAPVPDKGR